MTHDGESTTQADLQKILLTMSLFTYWDLRFSLVILLRKFRTKLHTLIQIQIIYSLVRNLDCDK